MPSREETYLIASRIVDEAIGRYGNGAESAWLGVYEALLWYESMPDGEAFPHIIDSNRFRRATGRNIWRERARAFESYFAARIGIRPSGLQSHTDQVMLHPEFRGLQRQNPLGIAFVGIIQHLLQRFGNPGITYRTEFPATDLFPGISLPGRSKAPQIDIAASRDNHLIAIISIKWSLRHDRMSDLVAECRAYKAAAVWTGSLEYHVVTNEFDPARLVKALTDECFDRVTHVHREAVVQA